MTSDGAERDRDRAALARIFSLATSREVEQHTYTPVGSAGARTVEIPHYTIPNPRHPKQPLEVYDVRQVFPDTATGHRASRTHKRGAVMHHDAVAFRAAEKSYTGQTVARALQRLHKVHRYHSVNKPWGGVGYQDMADLDGRIYITGDPSESRAGVAARDGDWTANETQHSSCVMGHYSDLRDPHGTRVTAIADRPPDATVNALDGWWQLLASAMGRTLTLSGHKDWQTKECPGSWYTEGNWASVRYEPQVLPDAAPDAPEHVLTYTVRDGDVLRTIAARHGVDWEDLARWNGITNPDLIRVGQVLRLAAPAPPAPPPPRIPPHVETQLADLDRAIGIIEDVQRDITDRAGR